MPEMPPRNIRLLYISYWGVREPLGQSLMVPPLLHFAEAGHHVTLVSFEKDQHLRDRSGMEESRRQLNSAGIHWIPLRYHKRPTAPATAFDIIQGAMRSILSSLGKRPDLVHGRTFLGGLMGYIISRTLRCPFVFHNEGFWPDEQVDGGHWSAASRPYQITKSWEEKMYLRSDAVITLSEPAKEMVTQLRPDDSPGNVAVVASCVDLDHFRPSTDTDERADKTVCRMVYLGSLGGRYRGNEMARFVKAVQLEAVDAKLTVYSHSDADMIRTTMRASGLADEDWSLDFVPHHKIPDVMQNYDVGLFFLVRGVSTRVCSPTKIGEYWACGLPVVTTPEVGDIDTIVRSERVGVVVEADTEEAYRLAARELRILLQDTDLPERCRQAAERYYSLERGVETQLQLYQRLTTGA